MLIKTPKQNHKVIQILSIFNYPSKIDKNKRQRVMIPVYLAGKFKNCAMYF